jgi:hypothetical protein
MSFDLAVWDPAIGLKSHIYVKLCEGQLVRPGESGSVRAFYDGLIKQWPEMTQFLRNGSQTFVTAFGLAR